MIEMIKVKALKSFSCALDGIGVVTKLLKVGEEGSIPKNSVFEGGLLAEGYVKVLDEVEKEVQNDSPPAIVKNAAYFKALGRKAMVELLEAADEELTGKESNDKLAELCEIAFQA